MLHCAALCCAALSCAVLALLCCSFVLGLLSLSHSFTSSLTLTHLHTHPINPIAPTKTGGQGGAPPRARQGNLHVAATGMAREQVRFC